MSTKAKLLSLLALAGVGAVEIPFLLHGAETDSKQIPAVGHPQSDQAPASAPDPEKKSTLGQDSPVKKDTTKEVQNSPAKAPKIIEKGNCEVFNVWVDALSNVLWSFDEQMEDYIAFTCKDTKKDGIDKLTGNWTGLFPKKFLENAWKLKQGDNYNIYTNTKSLEGGNYETIFQGVEIKGSSITGTWNEAPSETLEESKDTIVVKVEGREKSIYLVFDKGALR